MLKPNISVTVEYYNDKHRDALLKYPTAQAIEALVKNGLQIAVSDFHAYFLFHRIRANPTLFPNISSVKKGIALAADMLKDLISLEESKIKVSPGVEELPGYIVEHIGESIALSAINTVHEMTEADWLPIEKKHDSKTLDYMSSDGLYQIELEAKGRIVHEGTQRSSSISAAKLDIEKKKAASKLLSTGHLRYGVITAISSDGSPARAYILDPLPEMPRGNPQNIRLISRVEFLRWLLWLVSPRAQLTMALGQRAADLQTLADPFELSGSPLRQSDGSKFEMQYTYQRNQQIATFFANRSRISDGPAGGIVVLANSRAALLFVGFRTELLSMAIDQSFESILSYQAMTGLSEKTVRCVVTPGEFASFQLPDERFPRLRRTQSYVYFELEGLIEYASDGMVFGLLRIPPSANR